MERFDDNWRFGRAGDASQTDFDDSTWRAIDLPHDWSIEDLPPSEESPRRSGPFDPDLSGGKGPTGFFVGGAAWYRKRFDLQPVERAEIRFEAAYYDCDVWLNGQYLGNHAQGYTPFCFDITPFLSAEGPNVLAVRVKNEGWNSRWYTGSGLYRHVWLRTSGTVHIPMDGVYITTPSVTATVAEVQITVEVENKSAEPTDAEISVKLTDPKGGDAAVLSSKIHLKPNSNETIQLRTFIDSPMRWDLETPNLYKATIEVIVDGIRSDVETTDFGIRVVRFTPEEGFLLNGQSVKIKGGCVHHDNGLLGAAAIDCAESRRIELLKAAGFNGIRTSHNAPSTAFLDACDRLGMLVMDEAFDEWEHPKTADGYSNQFKDSSDAILTTQVRRDRNHPCVIMWSIGNEIPECFDKPEIALRLRNTILASDSTRAISQGICYSFAPGFEFENWEMSSDPAFLHLDVGGYNYQHANYEPDHVRHPERIMVGTESFPKDIFDIWTLVNAHPWLIGDFTWTALDYFGETGIGQIEFGDATPRPDDFPSHMAVCGDLDILGYRKPSSYYRQAQWEAGILYVVVGQAPDAHGSFDRLDSADWRTKWGWPNVRSHWTYPGDEGQVKQVYVYSSCDSVRLLLNGKLVGEKPTGKSERHFAQFDVNYESGDLIVIGLLANKESSFELSTAGQATGLRAIVDRRELAPDRNQLCYLSIEIVDAAGTVVPNASNFVEVQVTGPAELAAFGTADPNDVASVQSNRHRAWQGRLQAIIRPTGGSGEVQVLLESGSLSPNVQNITIKEA